MKRGLIRLLELDFVRFCIVGGTGFVINFVLLIGLTKFAKFPVFIAQFIGAEVALFSNFVLHHNWTYKKNKVKKTIGTLLVQFHATTWPAIIGSTLMVAGGVKYLRLSKLFALIISSAVALVWNFVWSKFVIWRGITEKEIEEVVS